MANQFCSRCGSESWGRVHQCVPKPQPVIAEVKTLVPAGEEQAVLRSYNGDPETNSTATYKYRDPDKRRAYMREYMQRWRTT